MAKAQQQNRPQEKRKRSLNLIHEPKLNWDQVNEIRRSYAHLADATLASAANAAGNYVPMGDAPVRTIDITPKRKLTPRVKALPNRRRAG